MFGKAMLWLPAVILPLALAGGCANSGPDSEEIDPVDLSAYLFAGRPDRTVVAQDPDNPERDVTWELRNLQRVQSFLAKSCAKKDLSSCRYLVLGYAEYRLDGSLEVGVSMPAIATAGILGFAEDLASQTGACVIRYHPFKGASDPDHPYSDNYYPDPINCTDEHTMALLGHLRQLSEPPYQMEGLDIQMDCALLTVAARICRHQSSPYCLETLPRLLTYAKSENCQQAEALMEELSQAQSDCQSQHSMKCHGDEVWWFDSCGEPEEFIGKCSDGCVRGACMEHLRTNCMNGCTQRHSFTPRPLQCGESRIENRGLLGAGDSQNEWSAYTCLAHDWQQEGPEHIYYYFAEEDGMLDIDLRVHGQMPFSVMLFENVCSPDTCTMAGYGKSSGLYSSMEKGTCYYIVVDRCGEFTYPYHYTLTCKI